MKKLLLGIVLALTLNCSPCPDAVCNSPLVVGTTSTDRSIVNCVFDTPPVIYPACYRTDIELNAECYRCENENGTDIVPLPEVSCLYYYSGPGYGSSGPFANTIIKCVRDVDGLNGCQHDRYCTY